MKAKTVARIVCIVLCIVLIGSILLVAIPALSAQAAAAPVKNGGGVITEDYVNLRSGAGYQYAVSTVMRRDTPVVFNEATLYSQNWYKITEQRTFKTGYVRREYVQAVPADTGGIRIGAVPDAVYVGAQLALWQRGAESPVWSSSNTSVATIDGDGILTALRAGTVNVTCTDGDRFASVPVTIRSGSAVHISKNTLELYKGNTVLLQSNTAGVQWSSSNPLVVEVADGTVTAVAPGYATVAASTANGAAYCLVHVPEVSLPPTITLNTRAGSTYVGCQYAFTQIGARRPVWSTSNSQVASIDQNGVLTAKSAGFVTVYCTEGSKSAVSSFTIKEGTSTGISSSAMTLIQHTSGKLTAKTSGVKWYSSDTNIATVSNGVVTTRAPGYVTISAYTATSASTCLVCVKESAEASGIATNVQNGSLYVGNQYALWQTGAKAPTWSSSNPDVASIGSDGVITAKAAGAVTISAKEGSLSGTCKLTVEPSSPAGISASSLSLGIGQSLRLTSSAPGVRWYTSNSQIATVSDGTVTGVSTGICTVTAFNAASASTCLVRVSQSVQPTTATQPATQSTTQPDPVPQPPTPSIKGVVTTDYLNVRSGAGLTFSILTTVTEGTEFTFLDQTLMNTDWYNIQLDNGMQGYVHRDYVEMIIPPDISLNISSGSTFVGCQYAFSQTGADAPEWSSSNPSVGTIDQNGIFTAKSAGVTVVSAAEKGGVGSCTFTVKNGTSTGVSPTTLHLATGATAKLTAKTSGVSWYSSNTNVATVSGGTVTARGVGYATVSAYTATGASTCLVSVTEGEGNIKILTSSASIYVGNRYAVPNTGANGAAWSSSNTSVATVDNNGVVTAKATGTVTITARNSISSGSCTITVYSGSTPSISMTSDTIPAGKSIMLTSGYYVSWSSSNTAIATVSGGIVDTKSPGFVTITASTGSGAATCLLHVTAPESVRFVYASPNSAPKGSTITFKAITDRTRTAVRFVVTNGTTSYTVNATDKVNDGSSNYVWSGSHTLSESGTWRVKAYAKTATSDYTASSGGEGEVFVTNASSATVTALGERRASDEVIGLIAYFEGFLPTLTDDYITGDPTIGHGKVIWENEQFYNNLTRNEAYAYLCQTVNDGPYSTVTNDYLTSKGIYFNQQQFDALVCFAYNLGAYALPGDSDLQNALLSGGYDLANTNANTFTQTFLMYHHAAGSCYYGLLWRRVDEVEMYLYGDYEPDGEYNRYGMYYRCYRNSSFGIG